MTYKLGQYGGYYQDAMYIYCMYKRCSLVSRFLNEEYFYNFLNEYFRFKNNIL
jgi:hypothetical protein